MSFFVYKFSTNLKIVDRSIKWLYYKLYKVNTNLKEKEMRKKLREVAVLKSGYQGKITNGEEGTAVKLIKLKDVSKEGIIHYEGIDEVRIDKVLPKHCLNTGDIIFKAKSGDNSAALIKKEEDTLLATAHYIIVSIKEAYQDVILPEYLALFFNSPYAQSYFKSRSEGSVLSIVKMSALEELEVIIPDWTEQVRLSELYKLMLDEKQIMQQLMKAREKQMGALLAEVVEKEDEA